MMRTLVVVILAALSGCQCVRLEDYRVCDATVDCDQSADASVDDAGSGPGTDGGSDGGCVPDGLVDALDSMGLDTDCDGVDGVAARQLYVDGDQGNDSTAVPGNPAQPFATIGAALDFAASPAGSGYGAVLVKSGRYDEVAVTWQANVDVWGGRSGTDTWVPTGLRSNLQGGRVGLVVRGVEGRSLRGFQVRAAVGSPGSIGVVIEDCSPRFVDVEVYAAEGGTGSMGVFESVPDAGPGLDGRPGERADFGGTVGPPGVCGGAPGSAGGAASKSAGRPGEPGDGPAGGAGGAPPSATCSGPSDQAQPGAAGDPGLDGMAGQRATMFGSLDQRLDWVGAGGTGGTFGTAGKPGSGGGGGGAPHSTESDSSSGGSGGSGGCPGPRGLGGASGGPSIGLVVRGGRPFIGAGTSIVADKGGEGGLGGPAGLGFAGGDGGAEGAAPANPECTFPYGSGARGGEGGRGGSGGRGGGGAGGHSFAIYCDRDGGFELDGGTLMPGAPGGGVDGARAGTSIAMQGCTP